MPTSLRHNSTQDRPAPAGKGRKRGTFYFERRAESAIDLGSTTRRRRGSMRGRCEEKDKGKEGGIVCTAFKKIKSLTRRVTKKVDE